MRSYASDKGDGDIALYINQAALPLTTLINPAKSSYAVRYLFLRTEIELGRNQCCAVRLLSTKLEIMHIPGVLQFCVSKNFTCGRINNGERY